MIRIPAYLKKGDTIGLVCPAGYMSLEKVQTCVATLQQWGYKVVVGSSVGGTQQNYFAGTDEERLQDLQSMLDNPTVKAILCARGGYGMSRIIDAIDFKHVKKNPKWIIGFSDITVLHAHMHQQCKIASLHAPMAGAFNDGGFENTYVESLRKALKGQITNYQTAAHHLNKLGVAEGQLIGGNLCMIAHLLGSKSAYNTQHKILFLEDVGEYLYNIDRMLLQLKRAGVLAKLKGLIVGGFTDLKDTTVPFGNTVEHIIHSHVKDYNYPVCFNFPVSHATENVALKVGVVHTLKVRKQGVQLIEQKAL